MWKFDMFFEVLLNRNSDESVAARIVMAVAALVSAGPQAPH
jgi:hypothetical protein